MTAQIEEILMYEGKKHHAHFDALYPYLNKNKELEEPYPAATNCYRGYEGQWYVKDKKLYLKKLKVYRENEEVNGMELYFSKAQEVFAVWFNGEIALPAGKETMHTHSTGALYEKYLVLKFRKGILTKTFERKGFGGF
ncbi:MAG: hypothetical protein ACJAYM_001586 [Flavobacteriales bacterium]|jgi:hypothetical protein